MDETKKIDVYRSTEHATYQSLSYLPRLGGLAVEVRGVMILKRATAPPCPSAHASHYTQWVGTT